LRRNSTAYLHTLAEAIKLAAADREAFYGDPKFVDTPIDALLSSSYAAERRRLIDPKRAAPGSPPPGTPSNVAIGEAPHLQSGRAGPCLDTSYVAVVDRHGNAFSATPSDGLLMSPIVPGLGLAPSARGYQSWLDPGHPSSVAPGKRPRLTPNPALAMKRGEFVMPFGSPGHDVQTQVMAQVFLNLFVFGMAPQAAIEAPRICTYSFPSSAFPHATQSGLLYVEKELGGSTIDELRALGHDAQPWPQEGDKYLEGLNAVCLARADLGTGVKTAAADPRRPAYALGW
jgi:gamma-glutamyltranspeptidase/glutathione hydrolase